MRDGLAMKTLSSATVESLKNLTNIYDIGHGLFVEKVATSAAVMGPDDQPALSQCPGCKQPWVIHHAAALTGNGSQSVDSILANVISGNLDIPFWQLKSRKLLVKDGFTLI
eukprot:scpid107000/ scgid21047/ 